MTEAAVTMFPVFEKPPVAGSYNSALARVAPLFALPPVTRTFPFASTVAWCKPLPVASCPVGVKPWVIGSNTSAVAVLELLPE